MRRHLAFGLAALLLASHEPANAQQREFGGLTLGVGLSLTRDLGKSDRVNNATIIGGIVRVTDERNEVARVMLESHYFFVPKGDLNVLGLSKVPEKQWGHGPFVAIQPGSNEIVEALAFGWMWGFKRSEDVKDTNSWNIGIGFVVDPKVKVLGDGFVANQPPPAGETEVRYKEKGQWGLLIISSFSF
jgi:hypothetical protein